MIGYWNLAFLNDTDLDSRFLALWIDWVATYARPGVPISPPGYLCLSRPTSSAFLKERRQRSWWVNSFQFSTSFLASSTRGCCAPGILSGTQYLTDAYLGTSVASEKGTVQVQRLELGEMAVPPECPGMLSSMRMLQVKIHLERFHKSMSQHRDHETWSDNERGEWLVWHPTNLDGERLRKLCNSWESRVLCGHSKAWQL